MAAEGLDKRNNYQRYLFPLLRQMDAETVHDRTVDALAVAQNLAVGRSILRSIAGPLPEQPVRLFGLTFPNCLGVAAGFDKEVQATDGLAMLGFGHIEVGTITPRPQTGNEKPRIFRLVEDEAIINRMGFPSSGMRIARDHLKALATNERAYIIGASLGKQKETPLAQAAGDYIQVMRAVFPFADYLAINISSPNTPELRALQGEKYLGDLIGALTAENRRLATNLDKTPRPILVKIAPDLSHPELLSILQIALDIEIDGIIATNTTIERNNLSGANRDQAGGLSGRPLADRSLEVISAIARETDGRLPIIGVGGIRTADDVRSRLDAGASLVQIYTALVYEGPGLPGRLLRQLAESNGGVEV
jgi:dihydroorotate dehydrogenase